MSFSETLFLTCFSPPRPPSLALLASACRLQAPTRFFIYQSLSKPNGQQLVSERPTKTRIPIPCATDHHHTTHHSRNPQRRRPVVLFFFYIPVVFLFFFFSTLHANSPSQQKKQSRLGSVQPSHCLSRRFVTRSCASLSLALSFVLFFLETFLRDPADLSAAVAALLLLLSLPTDSTPPRQRTETLFNSSFSRPSDPPTPYGFSSRHSPRIRSKTL